MSEELMQQIMEQSQPSYNHAWKRQRMLKKENIPTIDKIISMAQSFEDLIERTLFILTYQTGGRISEIVSHKYLKLNNYDKVEGLDKDNNMVLRIKRNKRGSPIIKNFTKIPLNYPGIRKKDITYKEIKGKRIMLIHMQNRKNKNIQRKTIPISMEKEVVMVDMVRKYLDLLGNDDKLFNFGVWRAEQIINKVGMNPHFLRDIRLTHMVTIYDFNAFELTKFAGWKNAAPAERYVRLSPDDLVRKY